MASEDCGGRVVVAAALTGGGVLTPRGKTRWSTTTIRSILTNEKYKGDALLQKTFTADFLTKTVKPNQGEVPQYYVTGNHEPIIDPAAWDLVRAEIVRRATPGASSTHPFASRIKCGQCGGWYGRKTWHSTSKTPPPHLAVQQQIRTLHRLRHTTFERKPNP